MPVHCFVYLYEYPYSLKYLLNTFCILLYWSGLMDLPFLCVSPTYNHRHHCTALLWSFQQPTAIHLLDCTAPFTFRVFLKVHFIPSITKYWAINCSYVKNVVPVWWKIQKRHSLPCLERTQKNGVMAFFTNNLTS